jgi:hypothetical protein
MDTPLALRLVRISWKLDDLPAGLAPVRMIVYSILGAQWKIAGKGRGAGGASASPQRGGLTLLARARKRAL